MTDQLGDGSASSTSTPSIARENSPKIGLGGGCHWCTEAVFQALRGVSTVDQGFISSNAPNESFSEAVTVTYDPGVIDLKTLIEIHLRTHSSTSAHSMREKYRSAVYVYSDQQFCVVKCILAQLQDEFENRIVTRVLRYVSFRPSTEQYTNYYEQDPDRLFCKRYIDPKLDRIRAEYSRLIRD